MSNNGGWTLGNPYGNVGSENSNVKVLPAKNNAKGYKMMQMVLIGFVVFVSVGLAVSNIFIQSSGSDSKSPLGVYVKEQRSKQETKNAVTYISLGLLTFGAIVFFVLFKRCSSLDNTEQSSNNTVFGFSSVFLSVCMTVIALVNIQFDKIQEEVKRPISLANMVVGGVGIVYVLAMLAKLGANSQQTKNKQYKHLK